MAHYLYLQLSESNGVATLCLHRPQIRNAFHEAMIREILVALEELKTHADLRVLVLKGSGETFCAGADLNWMKDVVHFSYEENLRESLQLAQCFAALAAFPVPTLAVVRGAAIGGANGLLAACDLVVAHPETVFSLSEVRIGVIPACIAPYVIRRTGEFKARELMLTGKRFDASEALACGLITAVDADPDAWEASMIRHLQEAGPVAIRQCKKLISRVCRSWTQEEMPLRTAEMIARQRLEPEAQEGMAAFLEKRKPRWNRL